MYYASPYTTSSAPFQAWMRTGSKEEEVIALILESVQGERNDELFYDYLIKIAPAQKDKDIIAGIRDDERKHRKLFRSMYYYLTGQMPPQVSDQEEPLPSSYIEGIETALMGELKAFEKYRGIYLNIKPEFRNWMFEIMTDEMKHAAYYNYLYAKNK
ncbi:ferritin-like domain-containing protein [Paenibacillus sp. FJAT-26967]|uniref:ferritin-like domain-containing protein n=1 Tax=Paenibacillus sp. FJAT-26967 TaxID=1729690 RepID=UPI00083995A0|nr:ferritin-like domain-containing protein [Paenibacillus sp. FJAT-26967]